MASYRAQRSRNSAASPSNRGSASDKLSSPADSPKPSEERKVPSAAPSKRRELEDVATVAAQHAVPRHEEKQLEEQEEYSTDVNDVYVENDSYVADEAEGADADGNPRSGAGLPERRRRLSYIIPSRDDRLEETTDVYPGRATGRFNYRNPSKH